MWIEISLAVFIIATAGHIIYHSLKTKKSGNCGCGSCSHKQRK